MMLSALLCCLEETTFQNYAGKYRDRLCQKLQQYSEQLEKSCEEDQTDLVLFFCH